MPRWLPMCGYDSIVSRRTSTAIVAAWTETHLALASKHHNPDDCDCVRVRTRRPGRVLRHLASLRTTERGELRRRHHSGRHGSHRGTRRIGDRIRERRPLDHAARNAALAPASLDRTSPRPGGRRTRHALHLRSSLLVVLVDPGGLFHAGLRHRRRSAGRSHRAEIEPTDSKAATKVSRIPLQVASRLQSRLQPEPALSCRRGPNGADSFPSRRMMTTLILHV
jgi:hypothetical protein